MELKGDNLWTEACLLHEIKGLKRRRVKRLPKIWVARWTRLITIQAQHPDLKTGEILSGSPNPQYHVDSECSFFGEELETISHLFLHGKVTSQLWRMFLSLKGISWAKPRNMVDVLVSWNRQGANSNQKERWKVIPAYWWIMWDERNKRCFEDKSSHIQKM